MTVRLDRVQRMFRASVLAVVPATVAIWAPASYPERDLGGSVVTGQIVRGPLETGAVVGYVDEPTTVRWTLASVAAGDRVGFSIGGGRWAVDSAGTDPEVVRDALLALFPGTPAHMPGVTVAGVSTNAIDFVADGGAVGKLWSPRAIGPSAVAVTASAHAETSTATARVTLELQAYADGRGVEASSLLAEVLGSFGLSDLRALREDLGVSIEGPPTEPIPVPVQQGADWKSRASARLAVSLRSYTARATEILETVDLTATTNIAGATIQVST